MGSDFQAGKAHGLRQSRCIPLDHGRMLYELTEQMHTNGPSDQGDAQGHAARAAGNLTLGMM